MPVTESTGDIFTAPPNSILLHACNALGSWSAGVALAFKKKYPDAFHIYHAHCIDHKDDKESLLGTCLLIPPTTTEGKEKDRQHWIGCLFTSVGYGRGKSAKSVIVDSTREAMKDLKRQVEDLKQAVEAKEEKEGKEGGVQDRKEVGEIWAVRINSGLFAVPWEETKSVLEESGLDVKVVRPEGEEEKSLGKRGAQRSGRGRGGAKRARGGGARGGRGGRGGLNAWLKG